MIALPEPGPERDALIAEYVMGWKPSHRSPFMVWFYDKHGDARPMKESWSTCDATALEVVEVMRADGWSVEVTWFSLQDDCYVQMRNAETGGKATGGLDMEGGGATFASAVTEAALKAKKVCF